MVKPYDPETPPRPKDWPPEVELDNGVTLPLAAGAPHWVAGYHCALDRAIGAIWGAYVAGSGEADPRPAINVIETLRLERKND